MYERRPGYFRNEDAPTGRRVEAKVKWFNAAKGFGFVTLSDGSPDAFLPMAILRRAGYEDVREGASVTCEVGAGAKGPLVVNVLNVDNSTAVAPGAGSGGGGGGGHRSFQGHGQGSGQGPGQGHGQGMGGGGNRPPQSLEGMVKWYEPDKGYGFISPEGGGKDIFVHVTALRRSGLEMLEPGQRVKVDVVEGRKGLEADRLTPL
ncbi:MAG TPA: cold shock domain-containing protein [Stellaceae bacterium]|nr:cold shock domain-containing protein [Stellaceae bacterium]